MCRGKQERRSARSQFRRLVFGARSSGGNAAVEFALAAPMLVGLLVPLADLGIAYSQQLRVQQAAQAGAQYAVFHPWNSNSPTAISGIVTSATDLAGIAASPAPSESCGCPTGAAVAAADCNSTCSDGEPAGYYVTVNARRTYRPELPYSILGQSVMLSAQATVRVR